MYLEHVLNVDNETSSCNLNAYGLTAAGASSARHAAEFNLINETLCRVW